MLNDSNRTDFLIHNLKPENFDNLIVAITLDFTKPWDFLDQLSKWADVIFELSKMLPTSKQNELRKKLEDHFKFYKNPDKVDELPEQTEENKEENGHEDEMKEALKNMALDDGILNINLGIPIIIILNKSEAVSLGETSKYFSQRLEFIMKHLREFALRYGASIMFTSTKKGTNLEELYTYMLHRYFDLPTVSPEITNRESILIPTGYDSPKLIQQLVPNINDPYDKIVIKVKATRELAEEAEVVSESLEQIVESLIDMQEEGEEDKEEPTPPPAPKSKKVDPNTFFKSLKEGGLKKDPNKASTKEKANMEDFKKKLFLKNLDS